MRSRRAHILALDQGTTGTRALILNQSGRLLAQAYTEFPQYFPHPGWVEHDPEEIWASTRSVIRSALSQAHIKSNQISSIGITNQRETSILWRRSTGRAIGRAIVWQCRRSTELCNKLKKRGLEKTFRNKTGLILDAYFSGTKIRWALDHWASLKPLIRKGDLLFGTIDSWLIWKLTGGQAHVTDPTNASRTLLYNIYSNKWDPELCKLLGVSQTILPQVKPSAGLFSKTYKSQVLPDGIPISGVAGDQQASLFGHGCEQPGSLKNTYGTGSFILLNTGEKALKPRYGLLTTLGCGPKGKTVFCLEGSIFISGAVVQWLRDALGVVRHASESEKIARSIPNTGGVYLVPAFSGLGAPYWNMDARGAIVGLTRGVGKKEITRAALESIAYQTRDCVERMRHDTGLSIRTLRVDGGATQNNFLMQFQSDILGISLVRAQSFQVTALGAAALAGIGAGIWRDSSCVRSLTKSNRRFSPRLSKAKREKAYAGWKHAVKWVSSY